MTDIGLNLSRFIIHAIFPTFCFSCRTKSQKALCESCYKKINFCLDPKCPICGVPQSQNPGPGHPCPNCIQKPPAYHWHRPLALYEDPLSKMVGDLKFGDGLHLCRYLADLLVEAYSSLFTGVDALLPVPLHVNRLKLRGYNQSLEIAKSLSKKLKIPFYANELIKVKETRPQLGLSREERLKNLKDAFSLRHKGLFKNKKVVIIDDVFTTGSTLESCAKVISRDDPQFIGGLTLAYREYALAR